MQTVTSGELLVTYAPDTAARQVRDLGDGLVEVPAGMSWYGLEQHLNRRGRSAPVLTDHLPVSVGGTLSVGGLGIGSVRYGMQVDHVERIQLIDGTGASRWCSPTDHRELFRFALGGLGTVGLIERAVLRTVPYQRYTHVHRDRHATPAELLAHTERIAQRNDIDVYCATLRGGRFRSLTGWKSSHVQRCTSRNCVTIPDLPFVGRSGRQQQARPDAPAHLWTDYVVPAGQFGAMYEAVQSFLQRRPSDRINTMVYVLIMRRSPDALSFPFAPAGHDPVSIGVGVYTGVPREHAAVAAIRRTFRNLLERCCELGGRPYLYGVNELDSALLERFYGEDVRRLVQLRSTYSVEHVNAHLPIIASTVHI